MKNKILVAMLPCLFFVAANVCAQPSASGVDGRPTVTVSATASVSAAPDKAVVRLGAIAESPDAAQAQNRINGTMRKVLDAITALGVPDKAIQTESLSLSPVYSQRQPGSRDEEPQVPQIIGYRAVNVISVELSDLKKIGAVVDAGINSGANRLQGISFQLDDAAAARSQALESAVKAARVDAETVASAMSMVIDGVRTVTVGGGSVHGPVPIEARQYAMAAATPVQPGQVDVYADVTVTYYIKTR